MLHCSRSYLQDRRNYVQALLSLLLLTSILTCYKHQLFSFFLILTFSSQIWLAMTTCKYRLICFSKIQRERIAKCSSLPDEVVANFKRCLVLVEPAYELRQFVSSIRDDAIHSLFNFNKAQPQPDKVIRDDTFGQWFRAASCEFRQRLFCRPRLPFVC